jgi:hypothetical protein
MPTFSIRYKFSDWPNPAVPEVAAGVYAIWEKETLIYCGMSGRSFKKGMVHSKRRFGLVMRLGSHATGRLSGDQFCVYVANRLVIPSITPEQLGKFRSGELRLDSLTKRYIHERFEYQFTVLETGFDAFALEEQCRCGETFGIKPLLNPDQRDGVTSSPRK